MFYMHLSHSILINLYITASFTNYISNVINYNLNILAINKCH